MAHSDSDSGEDYQASPVPMRSSAKRKRSAQACVHCRQRKIRCDGSDNCRNCQIARIECEHSKVTPEENRLAREKKQAARLMRRARETGEPLSESQAKQLAAAELAQAAPYSPSLAPRRRHEQRRKQPASLRPSPLARLETAQMPYSPISPDQIRIPTAPPMRPTQSLPTPPRQAFDTSPGALDRVATRFDERAASAASREVWPRRLANIPAPLDLSTTAAVRTAPALSADSAFTAVSDEGFSPMRQALPHDSAYPVQPSSGSGSADVSDDEEAYSPNSSVDDGFRFEGPPPQFTHKVEAFDWAAARQRRISYDYPATGLGLGPLDELLPFGAPQHSPTWSTHPPLSAGLFGPGTVSLAHITPRA